MKTIKEFISESLLDDDLGDKINTKSILVDLLKDLLSSKSEEEFRNNHIKLFNSISITNEPLVDFGNQRKSFGHIRGEVWVDKGYFIEFNTIFDVEMGIKIGNMGKAVYISWDGKRVKVLKNKGFLNYQSVVGRTFELPKELLKECRVLYKNAE